MINIGEYIALIKSLDNRGLEFLGIALALYYTSTLIYALRWKTVLAGMGRDISTSEGDMTLAFGWNPNIELLAIISLANLLFGLMPFTPGGVGIVGGVLELPASMGESRE